MKRFITISLLAALWIPMSACIWWTNHNNYLFSPYDPQEFRERVENTCNDNWKTYLGSTEEYYWFDADEAIKTARRKNDALMVTYIQNLQKYLKCSDEKREEQWDYPTKQQLAKRRQTLLAVRSYAETKLKSRLRSQHALLVMRCNMLLGEHSRNVTFWHTTGSKMIESVYRDMMYNIYAGALNNTGSEQIAGKIFAEQGDWASLMTMFYKRRSYQAIRQEYLKEPDSPVLKFLLKDFVNNAQEAIDADGQEGAIGGKLFIRDISKQEAQQMCQLCQQEVREGKTDVPVMWQMAKAWLEYLFGNKQQAVSDIAMTETMEGTERMKDNARVLRFYINAAQMAEGKKLDDFVASELAWLGDKTKDEGFFLDAQARITHQVLMKRYASQPVRLLAIEKATGCGEFDLGADTIEVRFLEQYITYATTPATTATPSTAPTPAVSTAGHTLDAYLKAHQHADLDAMNDLVGTKYMRLCRWDDALEWLRRVPIAYYNDKGYAPYAALRSWDIEPWIQRQWLKDDVVYGDGRWTLKGNPKVTFATLMRQLESTAALLDVKARCQRSYDLAIRYAQASFRGDCWFLMRDGKSVTDTVRCHETDFGAKALALLAEAARSSDVTLRQRALFARCYGELHPSWWYRKEWNDKTIDYDLLPDSRSSQYQAFAALDAYVRQQPAATYVSRCDEYQQWKKLKK